MEGNSLYDRMRKRVVVVEIKPSVGKIIYQSGIIVDCESNFAFIIADARQLMDLMVNVGIYQVIIQFPDGQRLNPPDKHFLIRNGVVGILCCGSFDSNLVKKIEIHNQSPVMSQEVRVYEGVFKRIAEGYITSFFGDHFSHNCAVAYLAEYGAPVVTENGELVGISDSGEYHLNAKKNSLTTRYHWEYQIWFRYRILVFVYACYVVIKISLSYVSGMTWLFAATY